MSNFIDKYLEENNIKSNHIIDELNQKISFAIKHFDAKHVNYGMGFANQTGKFICYYNDADMEVYYLFNGYLHRLDGQAVEYEDGSGNWWIHGEPFDSEELAKSSIAYYLAVNGLEDYE